MPLDTRIALTGQPLQLESPAAQYSQLMSVVNAGTQNQLAQMQMSAAQRAMLEEEGAQNYLADPTNDLTTAAGQRGLLRFGKSGQAVLKSLSEQRKLQTEEDKSKYEFEIKTLDRAINDLTNLTDLPSAFASIDRQVAAKSITPQQGAELKTRINNAPDFSTWQNQTITGMLDAKERLGAMADQRYQEFRGRPAPAAPAAPVAAVPTAPVNTTEAPLVRPTQAAVPLDKLTVSEDARGNKTYYLDGVPISGEKFAELIAASAASAPLSGTRAAFLASMAPAPAPVAAAPMAPAAASMPPAAAPMAPAAAAAPAPAPAQPDMANALALKIQGLQEERNKLRPFLASKNAKADFDDLGKQIDNLSKGFSVSAGGAYFLPGVGMVERPPTASEFEQLLASSNMTDAQKIAARAARVKKETTFAPGTTVNVNAGQKAEDVEFGQYVVNQYKDISARADVATRSLPALDINLKTLEKGFDTGFGTETIAAGAKVLAALGVQNAKDFATDAQTFLANANNAVLQKQLEQKGVQTAADADRITSTGAQLGNTKEANKFIISVAKAQLQRDIAQRKFYSDWRTENKTFRGAEDAWYAGPGGASLFDSPILKKYAEPVAGQAEARNAGLDKIFKKAP